MKTPARPNEIIICSPECEIRCEVARAGRLCPTISMQRAEVRIVTRLFDGVQPRYAS